MNLWINYQIMINKKMRNYNYKKWFNLEKTKFQRKIFRLYLQKENNSKN